MSDNQNSEQQPKQEEVKIPASVMINGGHDVTVLIRDPKSETGVREEKVKVRLIPLSQAGEYLELLGQMQAFVAFVCGKIRTEKDENGRDRQFHDIQWSDSILDDSLFALEEECRRYNDPRIARWKQRQIAAGKWVQPMAREFKELTNSLQKQS